MMSIHCLFYVYWSRSREEEKGRVVVKLEGDLGRSLTFPQGQS